MELALELVKELVLA
jgi:hypothetical protein